MIGSDPALHLQTSSWAAVGEGKNHLPAIWQTAPVDALLNSANRLFAWATFARDGTRRVAAISEAAVEARLTALFFRIDLHQRHQITIGRMSALP